MQFWQQQLMYKQLEELQRHHQLQHLGEEQKQHGSVIQMPVIPPMTASQIPALFNGMPLLDTSNYHSQNEFSRCSFKEPITSQMTTSNVNISHGMMGPSSLGFSNGFMLSPNHGQFLQSEEYIQQQHDPSLYGLPASNTVGFITQYSQVRGSSMEFSDLMAKESLRHIPNSFQSCQNQQSVPSFYQDNLLVSVHDAQEKILSGHALEDNVLSNALENGRQVKQSRETPCIPSRNCSNLDMEEKRILFGSDDGCDWATSLSLGMGSNTVFSHGNTGENSSLFNSHSSVQSGSWSALMQSALSEVSNREIGMRDEHSNLGVQNKEYYYGNPLTSFKDQVKCETEFDFSNSHSHFRASDSCDTIDGNCGYTSLSYSNAHFGSGQYGTPHKLPQSAVDFNLQNVQNFLIKKQNFPLHASDSEFSYKGNTWNANDSQSSSLEASNNVPAMEGSTQNNLRINSMQPTCTAKTHVADMLNADSNQVTSLANSIVVEDLASGDDRGEIGSMATIKLNIFNRTKESCLRGHFADDTIHGKLVLFDSSESWQGRFCGSNQRSLDNRAHAWKLSQNNLEKRSGENLDKEFVYNSQKELPSGICIQNCSHSDQSSDFKVISGTGAGFVSYTSGNQKFQAQAGQMPDNYSSPRFEHHQMKDLRLLPQMEDLGRQLVHTQCSSTWPSGVSKNQNQGSEQDFIVTKTLDVDENSVVDTQQNSSENMEIHFKHSTDKGPLSFDESAVLAPLRRGDSCTRVCSDGHRQFESQDKTRAWPNSAVVALSSSLTNEGLTGDDIDGHCSQELNVSNFNALFWRPRNINVQGHHSNANALFCRQYCTDLKNQISYKSQPDGDDQKKLAPGKTGFSSLSSSSPHGQEMSSNQVSDGCSASPQLPFVQLDQQKEEGNYFTTNLKKDQKTNFFGSSSPSISPSIVQNQNHPLQLSAVLTDEFGPSRKTAKKLEEVEFSVTLQKPLREVPKSSAVYEHLAASGGQADGARSDNVKHCLSRVDSRMLSFSSKRNEDVSAMEHTQASGQYLFRGFKHAQISPQMAPSQTEQCVNSQSNTVMDKCDVPGIPLRNTKATAECYLVSKSSECSSALSAVIKNNNDRSCCKQKNEFSVDDSHGQPKSHQNLPLEVLDHNSTLRSKKRKSVELVPWHKEITGEFYLLQSMRLAETDWAQATNRLAEKGNYEHEMYGEGTPHFWSRRRLTLATELMYRVFPSLPAAFLHQSTHSGFDKLIYMVAKAGLGDACNLVSCLGSDVPHSAASNLRSRKSRLSDICTDVRLLKVLENFVDKGKKLETDLVRFEKKHSMLDVRMECQGLERFTIVNRFAKFYGIQKDGKACDPEPVYKSFSCIGVNARAVPCPEAGSCFTL